MFTLSYETTLVVKLVVVAASEGMAALHAAPAVAGQRNRRMLRAPNARQ